MTGFRLIGNLPVCVERLSHVCPHAYAYTTTHPRGIVHADDGVMAVVGAAEDSVHIKLFSIDRSLSPLPLSLSLSLCVVLPLPPPTLSLCVFDSYCSLWKQQARQVSVQPPLKLPFL